MIFFKIVWTLDAIASLVVLYFFFEGLADGSVSGNNAGLWFVILAVIIAVLGGSIWLRNHQQPVLALVLVLLMLLPVLLYLAFIVLALLFGGRLN